MASSSFFSSRACWPFLASERGEEKILLRKGSEAVASGEAWASGGVGAAAPVEEADGGVNGAVAGAVGAGCCASVRAATTNARSKTATTPSSAASLFPFLSKFRTKPGALAPLETLPPLPTPPQRKTNAAPTHPPAR